MASARALGARGCGFESHVSDHIEFKNWIIGVLDCQIFGYLELYFSIRRHRPVVKTTGFHPVDRSSILRGVTIKF